MPNVFPRTRKEAQIESKITSTNKYSACFVLDMDFLLKVAERMCKKGYTFVDTELVEDLLLVSEKVLEENKL